MYVCVFLPEIFGILFSIRSVKCCFRNEPQTSGTVRKTIGHSRHLRFLNNHHSSNGHSHACSVANLGKVNPMYFSTLCVKVTLNSTTGTCCTNKCHTCSIYLLVIGRKADRQVRINSVQPGLNEGLYKQCSLPPQNRIFQL